ncbi:DNA-J protein, putative [Bodo saltans]|uniref:DNA-J protein, putative n=1 Tax=Bodo saltans TaxID=75058 RepID=A0A0S4JM78_BODSA|nr:DNA-J protein, putative [Bodo saltans]|eukprot:CUG89593.1 DNA-J protein, putative [Bodo saltans]
MPDIKIRYRELARQYHPDMPSGNPNLFREVTAAYNIIKAEAKLGKRPSSQNSSERTSSSSSTAKQQPHDFHKNHREHQEAEETLKREGSRGQRFYKQNQYYVLDALWGGNGWEYAATFSALFALGVWSADVMWFSRSPGHYKVQGLENLSREQQQPAERFIPLPPIGEATAAESGTMLSRKSPQYLRLPLKQQLAASRNQQFSTLRDFLFEYDLEGADVRRATVSRFPVERVEEVSILKQCPHFRSFHSESSELSYSRSVVDGLVDALDATPWAAPDAGNAAVIVANALASVVTVSPNAAKWTIVEYRDNDANNATTECLFALRNNKFLPKTGKSPAVASITPSKTTATIVPMVQRIIISGSSQLQYPDSPERTAAALAHKKSSTGAGVTGGVVQMKDNPSFTR